MPNLWAHIIFGEQVLDAAGQGELSELGKLVDQPELKQLFNLGCQGPDFLLYHNFFPWKKDTRMSDLGQRIHTQRCGPFLMEMIKHIAPYRKEDPIVAYTLGFITHYVLDRHVHPYVFARSGYEKWKHQRFEVMMDTIIAGQLKGIETWKAYAWKQIDVGKQLPQSIVDMFDQVTRTVFPEQHAHINKDDWHEAYRHITQAHRIFRDPYGIKRVLLFNQTDPFIYKRKLPSVDIMNELHDVWAHPTDETETSTSSVWDLWGEALHNASQIFALLTAIIDDRDSGATYEQLEAVIGDYCYDSGKPSANRIELQYAEPII